MNPTKIFTAIADQRRRAILQLLAEESLTAGAIAARFHVSWPAISRHLRVLKESGLVSESRSGRSRTYRIHPESLAPVSAWLSGVATSGTSVTTASIAPAEAPPLGREDIS